ncbi:hypothetical protein HID58_090233 [Brassica napus]|uniref:Uncharacterized protein n=1 Tax=Brassica napus TaxID=3708 RepID=A0ABQ7XAC2_BRANA|nr:hypothetical protein HID58_090233 [Brassica napus]
MLFMALSNSGPPLIFMTTILLGPKSNLVKLEYLDFSNNKLKGEIPGWLRSVQWLILSHNSFSSFGKSWEVSDLTQIQMLELGSNSFRGPLPNWILDHFSGSIPQCLSNTISGLQELNLRHNNFNGVFHPDMFLNTTILSSVDISDNQLEGELPKSLINCTTLEFLNVKSNRIKDTFPSWLGSLPSLSVMILRENELYGPLYYPHAGRCSDRGTSVTLSEEYLDSMYMYSDFRVSMEMVNKRVDTNLSTRPISESAVRSDSSRSWYSLHFCQSLTSPITISNVNTTKYTVSKTKLFGVHE